MNGNDKFVYICYLIASIGFFLVALMNFFNDETIMAVLYLCLGSTFLCLSGNYMNKSNKK